MTKEKIVESLIKSLEELKTRREFDGRTISYPDFDEKVQESDLRDILNKVKIGYPSVTFNGELKNGWVDIEFKL